MGDEVGMKGDGGNEKEEEAAKDKTTVKFMKDLIMNGQAAASVAAVAAEAKGGRGSRSRKKKSRSELSRRN